MLSELIKVAYPHLSEESDNLDSYYLVRLGELWGEGLIEEYLEGLQFSDQSSSNFLNDTLDNTPQNQILPLYV